MHIVSSPTVCVSVCLSVVRGTVQYTWYWYVLYIYCISTPIAYCFVTYVCLSVCSFCIHYIYHFIKTKSVKILHMKDWQQISCYTPWIEPFGVSNFWSCKPYSRNMFCFLSACLFVTVLWIRIRSDPDLNRKDQFQIWLSFKFDKYLKYVL